MDPARADELRAAWERRHRPADAPSPDAVAAVARMLEQRVPEPDAAVAITDADGRHRVAALAGGALYLVWAVPGGASVPDAARCRRVPLAADSCSVELSERTAGAEPVRHWWFELEDEPLVFRTAGEREEAFARALAAAVGWPAPLP